MFKLRFSRFFIAFSVIFTSFCIVAGIIYGAIFVYNYILKYANEIACGLLAIGIITFIIVAFIAYFKGEK